jgi:hypothetical protein
VDELDDPARGVVAEVERSVGLEVRVELGHRLLTDAGEEARQAHRVRTVPLAAPVVWSI